MNVSELNKYQNFIANLNQTHVPLPTADPSTSPTPSIAPNEGAEGEIDAVLDIELDPTRAPRSETEIISPTLGNALQKSLTEQLDAAKPAEGRSRRVASIIRNPGWEVFTQKFSAFAGFWNRKLLANASTIISGAFAIAGGYLLYTFMGQRAAAAALAKSGVPSVASTAPNLRTIRYAGAASLLANSVTLAEAIPQTVIAVVNIVSTIKEGVALKRQIVETKRELKELTIPATKGGNASIDPDLIQQREFELQQKLLTLNESFSRLPVQGFSAAAIGVMSSISLARGTISVAMVALYATSPTKLATVMTLSHVATILGTVAGGIGVFLGGAALLLTGRAALNTYKETNVVDGKIRALEQKLEGTDLPEAKKTAFGLELKLLQNQKLQLSYNLRHTLITLSSTLMLTFAGVAGLLGTVGVVTGPGALVFGGVALIFVGLSAGISIGHYFYRKRDDAVLAIDLKENKLNAQELDSVIKSLAEQVKNGALSDEELIPMLPTWNTPVEQEALLTKFKSSPVMYLKTHFSSLAIETTD